MARTVWLPPAEVGQDYGSDPAPDSFAAQSEQFLEGEEVVKFTGKATDHKLSPWQVEYLTTLDLVPQSYFYHKALPSTCCILKGGRVLSKTADGWAELTVLDVLRPETWYKAVFDGQRFYLPDISLSISISTQVEDTKIPLVKVDIDHAHQWLNDHIKSCLETLRSSTD